MNGMAFAVIKTLADGTRSQLAVYPTRKEAALKSSNHGLAEMHALGCINMRYCSISGTFLALSYFGAVVMKLTIEAVIVPDEVPA